jgi:alcohol dehydrogenase
VRSPHARLAAKGGAINALVYHGPGRKAWEARPDPEIARPTDAIVQLTTSTICGTDLHILAGDVPEVRPGTVLGHEGVGVVIETGAAVIGLAEGDRVLVSCITSCGRCRFCREGRYGLCTGGGGWILGHLVDGLQAEYARVPFAETSVQKVPEGLTDEQVLFLSDVLPTAYAVGVLAGGVQPGDTVAIVGTGPVGLGVILTSKLLSPGLIVAIDVSESRRDRAVELGADLAIDPTSEDAVALLRELTHGLGADVAVEAVGSPATFELCTRLVRRGGHVANVGVHGHAATLHLERLWAGDLTITTGLVDTSSVPTLLELVGRGRLDPLPFATHRFALGDVEQAYATFADPSRSGALKVVLDAAATVDEPVVHGDVHELHEVFYIGGGC